MDIAGLDPSIDVVYQTLDLIGIFLCGIIGGTIARARNFDLVGMAFLAITTALGGGMIRDVLIDAGPPAALVNPWYFAMALAGSLLSALVRFDSRGWEVFRVHSDAVVLGVWAVTGSTKALANDLLWSSALFLGVITVVGGGMIRDMMTGSVPAVFGGTTLYATPAVFTAGLMVGTYALHDSGALPTSPSLPPE
ncbi:MAG: trimeric intracellular cation channel family protein [Mycobacteriaceae bacterium]